MFVSNVPFARPGLDSPRKCPTCLMTCSIFLCVPGTTVLMNSASIATGAYPGVHGFYGNVVYASSAKGRNAEGAEIDFSTPAFIEDFGVVEAVRDSY
jgi:Type I phosphodiesterase / nucleotide pyrophosphatase